MALTISNRYVNLSTKMAKGQGHLTLKTLQTAHNSRYDNFMACKVT